MSALQDRRNPLETEFDQDFPRGFLTASDPLVAFEPGSPFEPLDVLGRDLPSLLQDKGFRTLVREMQIPPLPPADLPEPVLRLYYVRLGFLASAYINQVGEEPAKSLPRNIAEPLCKVCRRLRRPPILSYDGYALYNWKRFRPSGPIALGNIDTIQNFVHLYDEHWFILVHVEIEAHGKGVIHAIGRAKSSLRQSDWAGLNESLAELACTVWSQVKVLRRIPDKMDPALYYRTFRPYIRFFEGVVYEGIEAEPMDYRGETGAQSSLMPILVAFLKIPHQPTMLTNHLADMRRFMPAEHRALIERVERMPAFRDRADKAIFNDLLEAIATFRETHLGFAYEYIARWVRDPRGTGGTPYLEWLAQLIRETRDYRIA